MMLNNQRLFSSFLLLLILAAVVQGGVVAAFWLVRGGAESDMLQIAVGNPFQRDVLAQVGVTLVSPASAYLAVKIVQAYAKCVSPTAHSCYMSARAFFICRLLQTVCVSSHVMAWASAI